MNKLKIHFVIDNDEQSSNFSPSFGVGYLSSYLKAHLDNLQISLSFMSADLCKDIEAVKPDIIGFSCTSRYFIQFRQLANELKEKFNLPIIWGGVHISIAPYELPDSVALGVVGEGEETVLELLKNFREGAFHNLDAIAGIVFRSDGKLVLTAKRPLIDPLDRIPPPDLDLLGVRWGRSSRGVMLTSRGCPYKCRFCASSMFWDRTRLHSAEYVVNEMKELVSRYRVKEILIYDDFFTIDRKRVAKIAELKKQEPILQHLRFECLSRVDNFTEELARLLKDMGIFKISFGIESGCQKSLDYLKNGKVTIAQIEKALGLAKKYGFQRVGSFVIGSPFESADDIRETFAFVKKLDLNSVQITVATPFPGTELWEDGKKIGRIPDDAWSDDYYTLFGVDMNTDIRALLKGKILMTQLDLEEFYALAEEGVRIQNSVNVTIRHKMRTWLRKLIIGSGLGFVLKWKKRFTA